MRVLNDTAMAKRQLTLDEQPKARTRPSKRTAEAHKKLKRVIALRRAAKQAYKEASSLLEEVVEELGVSGTVELRGGRTAIIVDNFARSNTAFKRVGIDRYDIEIMD